MSSRARLLAGGFMLAALAAYMGLSACAYLSYHWASTWNRPLLARAARIDPTNAEPWRRLGHLDLFSAPLQDARAAADENRQAVSRNPLDAYAWLQLALAQQALGAHSQEMESLQHALRSDPAAPAYVLAAAQAYLAAGEQSTGLKLLRTIAERHPDSLSAAVTLAWRATHSASAVVESVIPAHAAGQLFLLSLLCEHQEPAQADWLWSHIVQEKLRFPSLLAAPYVETLLQQNRGAAALAAWNYLARADYTLAATRDPRNLVTNAGFETDIQNALLDWRYRSSPGVAAEVDAHQAHSGERSLHLDFSGAVTDVGITQFVPVVPGARYQLFGFYRTQRFEGAGGVAWALVDPVSSQVLGQTSPLPASSDWQPFTAQFQAPAGRDLVLLELVRIPAGDQLRGGIWFDDLAIRPR